MKIAQLIVLLVAISAASCTFLETQVFKYYLQSQTFNEHLARLYDQPTTSHYIRFDP